MRAYYELLEEFKTQLLADEDVNSVTFGDLEDVDLNKTSLYNLVHFGVSNASVADGHIAFTVTILAMGIVSQYKEGSVERSDVWLMDNQQDVLNTTLGILQRAIKNFQKGAASREGFKVEGTSVELESFKDRFDDDVAGWIGDLVIKVPATAYFCEPSLYPTSTVWDFNSETLQIFFNRNLQGRNTAATINVYDFDDTLLASFAISEAQSSGTIDNKLTISWSGALTDDEAIEVSSKNTWLGIPAGMVTDAFNPSGLSNIKYTTRRESLTHRVNPPQLVKYQWDQNALFAYLDFTEAVDIGNGLTADVTFYRSDGVIIGTFDLNTVLGSSGTRLELALDDFLTSGQRDRLNDGGTYVEIAAGAIIADADGEHVASTVGLGNTGNNSDTWVA